MDPYGTSPSSNHPRPTNNIHLQQLVAVRRCKWMCHDWLPWFFRKNLLMWCLSSLMIYHLWYLWIFLMYVHVCSIHKSIFMSTGTTRHLASGVTAGSFGNSLYPLTSCITLAALLPCADLGVGYPPHPSASVSKWALHEVCFGSKSQLVCFFPTWLSRLQVLDFR